MNVNDNIGTVGGSEGFLSNALKAIGGLAGGNRTSNSVSGTNTNTIQFNPTIIANAGGGSPSAAPYNDGGSVSAPSTASSTAAGQDPSSLYNRALPTYRSTAAGQPFYDPLNTLGGGTGGTGDLTIPLLIGAGLLFFALNE